MSLRELLPWNWGGKSVPVRREPEEPLAVFRREVDGLFDRSFEGSTLGPFFGTHGIGGFLPRIDVSENDEEVRIVADLPGMSEKDVKVTLAESVLTLEGKKEDEREEKGGNYHYMSLTPNAGRGPTRLGPELWRCRFNQVRRLGSR